MPCPIKTKDESYIIAQEALNYFYNEKMKACVTMDEAQKEIDEYAQVKRHITRAFDKLEN